MKRYLVTGAAGFIGFSLTRQLLARGDHVVGLDNLNAYYSVKLKEDRLAELGSPENFIFVKADLADQAAMKKLFSEHNFDVVVHLGAQAGVRYSLENPEAYVDSNIVGFTHILEGCRHQQVEHLVFASSSSVYGANGKQPFSENDNVDHPLSFYAASKKANELMAHTYASLYQLPCTGLRFFTVYGPWGRPDMALFLFTQKILAGEPIDVYNHGDMSRDFTFIDDIVEGVMRVSDQPAQPNREWSADQPDPATSYAPYRIYNIGNNAPVSLMHFIESLEQALGVTAEKNKMPLQPGDVPSTYADATNLFDAVGFKPETSVETGIQKFVAWYREYFQC